MKISRVKHITFYPVKDMFEEVELQLHGDFTESKADKTSFVPTEESVRSLPAGDISLENYDYPDGKDDGEPVQIGRKRGVDIAELSEEVRKQQGSISEQWREFKANEKLDEIARSANSNSGSQGQKSSE